MKKTKSIVPADCFSSLERHLRSHHVGELMDRGIIEQMMGWRDAKAGQGRTWRFEDLTFERLHERMVWVRKEIAGSVGVPSGFVGGVDPYETPFGKGDRVRVFHNGHTGTVLAYNERMNLVRVDLDRGYKVWQAPCSLEKLAP